MGVSRAEGEDSLDSKKYKFSIKKPSSVLGLTKHAVSIEANTPAPGPQLSYLSNEEAMGWKDLC